MPTVMARLLGDHLYPDFGMNLGMQPDRHRMEAQQLDGVLQLDPPAVHLDTLLRQTVGDVLRRHRTEQLALLARLAGERHGDRRQAGCERLGLTPLALEPRRAGPGLG